MEPSRLFPMPLFFEILNILPHKLDLKRAYILCVCLEKLRDYFVISIKFPFNHIVSGWALS